MVSNQNNYKSDPITSIIVTFFVGIFFIAFGILGYLHDGEKVTGRAANRNFVFDIFSWLQNHVGGVATLLIMGGIGVLCLVYCVRSISKQMRNRKNRKST